jgi:hypothetical protein
MVVLDAADELAAVELHSVTHECGQVHGVGTVTRCAGLADFVQQCLFGVEPCLAEPSVRAGRLLEALEAAVDFLQEFLGRRISPFGELERSAS